MIAGLIFGSLYRVFITFATFATQNEDLPFAVILLIFGSFIGVLAYIWAIVGIWRAAGKYHGSRLWPIITRVLIGIGVPLELSIVVSNFFIALSQ